MSKKSIILTISAYGAMSDPTTRYRAVIVANTQEEFRGKLRDFFVNEVNRAKTVEDFSDSKITEIVITDKIIIPIPGDREIITIPELGTAYHIENPLSEIVYDHIDENHPGRNAYVFTSYKYGFCCEESEFPDAMAICFIDDTQEDNAKQRCEETTRLMGWDCQKAPVF